MMGLYMLNEGKQEFKIYKDKKGYVLETRKNGNSWRKDNNHNGKLNDIIEKIQ
jgi:hypothetical protein